MKILFLTPSVRPLGARRSLVELIRFLPDDIEVSVVCSGSGGISAELEKLGVPVHIAPQGAWRKVPGRIRAIFSQIPKIRRVIEDFKPDLLHANEFHIVPQAVKAAGKTPVCAHVRLSITERQIRNYFLGDCERIVTVSEAVKGLFTPSGLDGKTRVVYNGVDLGKISPHSPPNDQVSSWLPTLVDPPPIVFGLFGLISERKQQHIAAEALALANKRGANAVLLLAGDAFKGSLPYGETLRTMIEMPALKNRVLWLPFQSDVAPLYSSIDCNLLISSQEGFGRTIIEAGAAGKPSIGSRIGGIPELIDERTGWLVDCGDVNALADLMLKLSNERNLLAERGNAALEKVNSHFTIQAHVDSMINVWRECISNSNKK